MKIRYAIVFLLISLQTCSSAYSDDSHPKGAVCWPLGFAGIVLGVTTDSQVKRLLGPGIARPAEGDTGGRYFTDAQGRAMLHTISYTDGVVGELTVSLGIDPSKLRQGERRQAISKWFNPREGFGNWHALHLGSLKKDVLKNLGKPEKQTPNGAWVYGTTCTCELPQYFTLYFRGEQVTKVVFSAPPG